MKFTQPKLQFSPDSLEPVISHTTIDFHYGKHTKAYLDNLNKLIVSTKYEEMQLEEIIKKSEGIVYNNAAQLWNHIFYFTQITPNGKYLPESRLKTQVNKQFKSFDNFKELFEKAGMSVFGSGWVWLSSDLEGKLFITQTQNADNPLKLNLIPIFTIDLWEHAYYLDYQNRRGEYMNEFWKIVDWEEVSDRYEEIFL